MVASRSTKNQKASAIPLGVIEHVPAGEESKQSGSASEDTKPKTAGNKRRASSKTKPAITETTVNFARGSRGIDTLLRNAYRSQLDMLALAATKANIMISLNGLLMSMLVISSTQIASINGIFVIPLAVFLVTCAAAITFAVFAARPAISREKFNYDDFMCDDARLMVFEEFSDLEESEYLDAMTELLKNPARTYRSMLSHIHELGVTADKKYQHLYHSYTVFMAGTILTVVSLLTLVGLRWYGVLELT